MFIPFLGSLLLSAMHLIDLFYLLTVISVCGLEEKFLEHTCLLSVSQATWHDIVAQSHSFFVS